MSGVNNSLEYIYSKYLLEVFGGCSRRSLSAGSIRNRLNGGARDPTLRSTNLLSYFLLTSSYRDMVLIPYKVKQKYGAQ